MGLQVTGIVRERRGYSCPPALPVPQALLALDEDALGCSVLIAIRRLLVGDLSIGVSEGQARARSW
jgi:hypothetical protein